MVFKRHGTTTAKRKRQTASPENQAKNALKPSAKKPGMALKAGAWLSSVTKITGTARLIAFLTLGLAVFGVVMVGSASLVPSLALYGTPWHLLQMQLLYLLIGVTVALALAKIDYHTWDRPSALIVCVGVAWLALVTVKAVGPVIGGSRRWLPIMGLMFQPSEFAKLVVVVAVASFVARYLKAKKSQGVLVGCVLVLTVPTALLVMAEPDFGTGAIVALIGLVALFAIGVSGKALGYLVAGGALFGAAYLWWKPYTMKRFLGFLHPGQDLLGKNYQLHQSKIAIASGHLFGVGFGASKSKWGAIPNPHTDFIFSVVGEEFGLIGTCVLLGLFGGLIWLGVRASLRAPDAFGSLLALGIATWFGMQIFINIASVVGLFPVTGVPLPLISYGGTAMIADVMAIGLLINVATFERKEVKRVQKPSPTRSAEITGLRASSHRSSRAAKQLTSVGAPRAAASRPRRTR